MTANLPSAFVDEWSLDRSGWARFSADHTKRFRLGRALVPGTSLKIWDDGRLTLNIEESWREGACKRICFLMINPSVANAFKPDRTVDRCIEFATSWGGHVLEVVNLFAFITPHPEDLRVRPQGELGCDAAADLQILDACRGAYRVIAGWGTNGTLHERDRHVRRLIAEVGGIELQHLGLSKDGHPKHPLARGKHRIPSDQQPQAWAA